MSLLFIMFVHTFYWEMWIIRIKFYYFIFVFTLIIKNINWKKKINN